MKKALFVLPSVAAVQSTMINAATRQVDEGKRQLRFARSVKTTNVLTMFGTIAASCGGELAAHVGRHYVTGKWENGNYFTGYNKDAVHARIRLRDLDSFKDERLVSVLEMLESKGWTGSSHDFAFSEQPNRDYVYDTGNWTLTIDARVKSDSESCRRVKTGETIRTVVDEEWKIECD